MSRWVQGLGRTLAVVLVAAGAIGCGEVKIDPGEAPADAAGNDASPGETGGGDSVAATDSAGAECKTDFDCAGMKGKTPCNLPSCDQGAGKCVLKLREVGEKCTNPLDEAGECELATCNAAGACVKAAVKDGVKCGLNACGKKCAAGACVATTKEDYDDKNPCTTDYCDQGKEVKHDPITSVDATCDDGDLCTQEDICVGGQCKGNSVACADSIACTIDTCDKAKGCVFLPKNEKCNDNDPCVKIGCDLSEGCTATGIKTNVCDDSNPCTEKDQCDNGKCKGKPSASACACKADADCKSKNSPCGGKFKCNTATKGCELDATTVVTCPQSAEGCTTNTCNPTTGSCDQKNTNDGKECEDDNKCTNETKCVTGACKGVAVSCDDSNPCTTDACDPDSGCSYAVNAQPCDDGKPCTTGDACTGAGVCAGAKVSCDDGVACTYDACDDKTGKCTQQLVNAPCDDKNPCTTDTCTASGCTSKPDDAGKCDDGNSCTEDKCQNGACKSTNTCQCTAAADCDDKNPCTSDTCSAGKCAYVNAPPTQACDVANKCMQPGTGTCQAGVCAGGKPKVCPGDACNTGQCDATTGACGLISKADGTPCDADKYGCTPIDVCKGGKCVVGAPANCPATDCAAVACKSTGATTYQCASTPEPKGKACDDNLFCTDGDLCDGAGKCVGAPKICLTSGVSGSDPTTIGPCTGAKCNEQTKTCDYSPLAAGSSCEDGKFCTANDKCNVDGACVGGAPPSCPNGTGCQVGFCDESKNKCGLQIKPGCCVSAIECDDGYSCTSDACMSATNTCTYTAQKCCDQNAYLNDLEQNQLKSLQVVNSAGASQGWQLTAMPAICPSNGQGCQPGNIPGSVFLYYGDIATWNFAFGPSNGELRLPPRKAPTPGGWSALKFNLYMATENLATYDVLSVFVQPLPATPGGPMPAPLLPAWVKPQDFTTFAWHAMTIDMAPSLNKLAAGAPYQVVIRFDTVDGAANDGMGVLIDGLIFQVEKCN